MRTVRELAKALGISERMTHTYLAKGMREACRQPDGSYDVAWAQAWREEQVRDRQADAELKQAQAQAQVRKLEADAIAKELKNDLVQGNLWHKDDVLQWARELVILLKTRVEQLPDRLELLFPGEQREYLLQKTREAVRLWLAELAAHEEELAGLEVPAAAATDDAP